MFRRGFSFMTLDYRAKKCIKTYNYPWGPVFLFKGLKGSFNLCVVLIMFCLKRFWVVKLRSLGNQAGPTTLNWWTHCFAVCLDCVQGVDLVWPVDPAWNSEKTTLKPLRQNVNIESKTICFGKGFWNKDAFEGKGFWNQGGLMMEPPTISFLVLLSKCGSLIV